MAGVELEHPQFGLTDGTYLDERYFNCGESHAAFVPYKDCKQDTRFEENKSKLIGLERDNKSRVSVLDSIEMSRLSNLRCKRSLVSSSRLSDNDCYKK